MSRPKFGCEVAAETLRSLVDQKSEASSIDNAVKDGRIEPEQLVLTSMGTRRQAIITPHYPAIQFEAKLAQRISWGSIWNRPFVEAAVGLSRQSRVASLTLRLLTDYSHSAVNEATWQYPLDETTAEATRTTWDVVDAITENAVDGYATPRRSGLVVTSERRFSAGNWAVTHTSDPNEVVEGIAAQVSNLDVVRFV